MGDELHVNTSLRALDLSFCSITSAHLASLCGMLRVKSGLQKFDMISNYFEVSNLQSLCLALACNRSIQELILKENDIDDEGMVFVCEMLRTMHAPDRPVRECDRQSWRSSLGWRIARQFALAGAQSMRQQD